MTSLSPKHWTTRAFSNIDFRGDSKFTLTESIRGKKETEEKSIAREGYLPSVLYSRCDCLPDTVS